MWLKKRSKTDNHEEAAEIRCQPVLKQPVANFSYPRTDFVHLYRKEQPSVRDSQGSESSAPPLVEDHGSDLSAEDYSQYRAIGAHLWDSYHTKEHEERKADSLGPITSTARARENDSHQEPAVARHNTPTTSGPLSSGSQRSQGSRRVVVSCPEQRPNPPKPPPKPCYSLFPPSSSQKRAPAPIQTCSAPRHPGLEPSPLSLHFPPTPSSRGGATDGKGITVQLRPRSPPRATTPGSVHGGSIAASSTESIPLLLRSPGPTPPASPSGSSSSEGPSSSEVPKYPLKVRKRAPSHTNLRNFSLSKFTTRSSPSLANLAKAHPQAQEAHDQPPLPTNYHDRPLPPLPTERPPSPPHVSVFETDSDDEDDDEKGRLISGETKNFARRFMHGLVHHHHHDNNSNNKREKGPGQDHKRSVSDDGPSTSTSKERIGAGGGGGGGGKSGLSRTLGARYRRGGALGESARTAVSMDLPREGEAGAYQQVTGDEGEGLKGGRFLERFLRRKG